MSWQLGASVILLLALAAGFAWYERARPDARIVALVATLAAFAALGRIAFAAVPNVKPTTDIVLIAGYALGAGPGFVVGALAGLTSNFFFGQGPWTPWQMAAWGAAGLIGAGLGAVTRHRIRRWPLALACMGVGFAFTAIQDVGDWINYSDHSRAELGIYVGKGLGFDAVHAAGCLFFALAFGPALVSSVGRFATRLHVTWRAPSHTVATLVLAAAIVGAAATRPGPDVARAAGGASPTTYLLSAQNADGGFGSAPGQASSELFSGWAALGLAAEGHNPAQVAKDGHSVIAYLRSGAGADTDPGSLERTILAAVAAGADPRSFGGHDLVSALEARIGRAGAVQGQTNLTSFAVLALRAAGVGPPARTVAWLSRQHDHDGGFNFATAGGGSDVDDTGAVLEALSEHPGRVTTRAVAFLASRQNGDGGFPSFPGGPSNAQSTAWAAQGLLAAGAGGDHVIRASAYLRSLITPDGHVRYSRSSDQTPVWVTAQAVMALAEKPLPLAPVARRRPKAHRVIRRPRPRGARKHSVRRHRRAAVRTAPVPAGAAMGLAADAGILDALVLAPIGVG